MILLRKHCPQGITEKRPKQDTSGSPLPATVDEGLTKIQMGFPKKVVVRE
jgi:hypothetical protein